MILAIAFGFGLGVLMTALAAQPRKRKTITVTLDPFDGFNYPTSYASMNTAGHLLDEQAMSKPFGVPEPR